MKTLSNIVYGLFVMLLLGIAALFFLPASPLSGNYDVKIVKSGSMEPSIMTGGIVVIHARDTYVPGDVVTFKNQSADIPTTHRILSVEDDAGKTMFVTKGDANEDADSNLASRDAVLGKVLFTVPYVGYILDFARQPIGFGLLIVLPALLIVFDEMGKIVKEFRRRRNPIVTREDIKPLIVLPFIPVRSSVRMMDINRPVIVHTESHAEKTSASQPKRQPSPFEPSWVMATSVVLVVSTLMVNLWSIEGTISYFNDTETAAVNRLAANALDFKATSEGNTFTFVDGLLDDPDGLITLVAPEVGSVALKYSLKVEYVSGNQFFCDAIQATTNTPFLYDGPLPALLATNVIFAGPWTLDIGLLDGAYVPGDICVVDIVYAGWNQTLEQSDGGYDDEERVTLTFTAPALPLNGARMFNAITDTEEPPLDVPPVDEPIIETPPTEPAQEEAPPIVEEVVPEEPIPEVIPEPEPESMVIPDAPTEETPLV